MDRRLIEEKLESLRRCVGRIEDKRPESPELLLADADLQDIISLNLTRAVQLCVDIGTHMIAESDVYAPSTMAGVFDTLAEMGVLSPDTAVNLKKAVGFRNITIHNYKSVDWRMVFDISLRYLGDFRVFAREIAARLEK